MSAGELICGACGSRWYSAAAEQMIARDAPCPSCGGGPLASAGPKDAEASSGAESEEEEAQL